MVKHNFAKPKAIIFDLCGTVFKTAFINKILFPYIRNNINEYVDHMWTQSEDFIKDVERIRIYQNDSQTGVENAPKIASIEESIDEQKQSLINNVLWFMDNKKDSRAHVIFRYNMWFDGFTKDKIKTPVYSDVAVQLNKWKTVQNIKLYVFSHGWTEVSKRFMINTTHGDINFLIDGYYDKSFGSLTNPQSYQKMLNDIKEEPNSVFFLTKSADEARAGKEVGINAILVVTHKRHFKRLTENDKIFPIARSFREIEFE